MENVLQKKSSITSSSHTILVKKADGTQTRMSLQEFQMMRKSENQQKNHPEKIITPSLELSVLPMVPSSSHITQFRAELNTVAPASSQVNDNYFVPKMPPSVAPLKKTMHDVEAPQPHESTMMGPTEEMQNFSLEDFRRLGARPEAASTKLLEKFNGWKAESYLLYMQTLDAWRKSPLYMAYQRVVVDALKSGKTIHDLLETDAHDALTEAEFIEIIKVNKILN